MATYGEYAARIMKHYADHSEHGYTQGYPQRWGTDTETITIDGNNYVIKGWDRDCSSGVISAYEALGINCGGATYTGDMRQCMTSTGNFVWHPMSSGYVAQAGDIYLNEASHTAMCISVVPDMLAEFSVNEFGGIMGGQPGDQTGWECSIGPYYDFPWDGILECVAGEIDTMPSKDEIVQAILDFQIDGVRAQDRINGINQAIEIVKGYLELRDDPTGRNVQHNYTEQSKWNGKLLNELNTTARELLERQVQ